MDDEPTLHTEIKRRLKRFDRVVEWAASHQVWKPTSLCWEEALDQLRALDLEAAPQPHASSRARPMHADHLVIRQMNTVPKDGPRTAQLLRRFKRSSLNPLFETTMKAYRARLAGEVPNQAIEVKSQ